ncbi:hypothetical protein BUALT_Bualt05G0030200 [Buddleja alternifolia]|uniref:Uncharacterized protein n=1 Tax=Buddleja alternifolia TaxID=168488 RepID=A0AAV6XHR0_9LAMI|nr:hypothetical protein BUALT_Bualt05G0030200 [Buddleja alternifolia]
MSSEELPQNPNSSEENAAEKKLSKKELAKLERHQEAAGVVSAISAVNINDDNPLAANYGEIPFNDLQSKRISGRKWTEVNDLTIKLKDKSMLIRGCAQTICTVGKKMGRDAAPRCRGSWPRIPLVPRHALHFPCVAAPFRGMVRIFLVPRHKARGTRPGNFLVPLRGAAALPDAAALCRGPTFQ